MRRLILVVLLVLVVFLYGCRAEPSPEVSTPSPSDPAPTPLSSTSPLATPLSGTSPLVPPGEAFVPTPIPQPASDQGSVTGRLVDYLSGKPALPMVIYLGTLSPLKIEGTESHLVQMQPGSSPDAEVDEHGYFAFVDIQPGVYAMVAWTPVNSWVISDPATELDILVTIEAGKITELGELAVDLPN